MKKLVKDLVRRGWEANKIIESLKHKKKKEILEKWISEEHIKNQQ